MTAIEWLHEKLAKSTQEELVGNINTYFKQAKDLEKRHIMDAWVDGNDNEPKEVTGDFAKQYYKETFNKQ